MTSGKIPDDRHDVARSAWLRDMTAKLAEQIEYDSSRGGADPVADL